PRQRGRDHGGSQGPRPHGPQPVPGGQGRAQPDLRGAELHRQGQGSGSGLCLRHRRRPRRHPGDHLQGGDRDRPVRRAGRSMRRRLRLDPGRLRDPGGGRLRAGDGLLRDLPRD
ncbi:hypothetical protein GLDPPO_GLDPPO_00490, partial [Dysosmobacter welbionis]